jgi:hypothetical protein
LLALALEILLPALVHAAAPSLDWQPRAEWRTAELKVVPTNRVDFTLMSATATGLQFTNVLAEARGLTNQTYMNGSGVACGDVDGDGWCDLYFGVDPETPRHDAGRGLWLKGDGQGTLTPVPAPESGVMVNGEGRGTALSDYDGDGRVDLVVTQNGAATKLYHNERAKPGLRVRLSGPPGNRAGLGTVLRLAGNGRAGPAREVHAGSGYWSQDSAVQVLAWPTEARQLQLRWPGGKPLTIAVPEGAKGIPVDVNGGVTAVR